MKIARYAMLGLASLPGAYWLAKWWLGSWWSERTWTWLNKMLGHDVGLTSDVELLLVLACAFAVSFAATSFLFWAIQRMRNVPAQKSANQVKEAIYVGLFGFWILFATYFILWIGNLFGVQVAVGGSGLGFWAYLSMSFVFVLAVTLFVLSRWWRAR